MSGTALSFSDRERALPPTKEISELIFVVNKLKYNNAFRVSILQNRRKKRKIKCRPRSTRRAEATFFLRTTV